MNQIAHIVFIFRASSKYMLLEVKFEQWWHRTNVLKLNFKDRKQKYFKISGFHNFLKFFSGVLV